MADYYGQPNLWDMSDAGKINATRKIDALRGNFAGNDLSGLANQSREPGQAAQGSALGMYGAMAQGTGPSVAREQWRAAQSANSRAALAMAAQGRGGNLAGMYQQTLAANAGAQANTNQQMAALAAQEQQAGMAGYADLASRMYGQGLSYDQLASQQALQSDANQLGWYSAKRGMDLQAGANRWNRTMGLVNAGVGVLGAVGDAVGSDERIKQNIRPTDPFAGSSPSMYGDTPFSDRMSAELASRPPPGSTAALRIERVAPQAPLAGGNEPAPGPPGKPGSSVGGGGSSGGGDDPVWGGQSGILDDMMYKPELDAKLSDGWWKNGGGGGVAFSDENVKQGVNPTTSSLSATQAVGAIQPVSYEYKPGYGKPGERVGFLAQDLERTPAGAAIVNNTTLGKTVDVGGMASLALASQAESLKRERERDARLKQLEDMVAAGGYGGGSSAKTFTLGGAMQPSAAPSVNARSGPQWRGA